MLLGALVGWWYTRGWASAAHHLRGLIRNTLELFSVSILVRTLFKPWRQIITFTGANTSIKMKARAVLDNLVSRAVGFTVRIGTILIAILLVVMQLIIGVAALVLWPAVPLAPILATLIALGVSL